MVNNNSNSGVIYSDNAYVGLWVRILAILIDSFSLLIIGLAIYIIWTLFQLPEKYFLIFVIILSFIYLTVVKSSKTGTFAYILLKLKVVDLNGNQPSLFKMITRFALLVTGPLNIIIDMIWLTSEQTKQTLRDKIAGTYVIKQDSLPIELGIIKYKHLDVMGYALSIKEVQRLNNNPT